MIGSVLDLTTTTRTSILIRLFSIFFVLIQLNDSEQQNFSYTVLKITKFNFLPLQTHATSHCFTT
jgi:hypothetical protein